MNAAHDTVEVDLLVIGYGKSAKTLATHFARLGRSVVMVEHSPTGCTAAHGLEAAGIATDARAPSSSTSTSAPARRTSSRSAT